MPEIISGPVGDHQAEEDALEPFCPTCGVRASIFTNQGGRWLHYTGEPQDRAVQPYDLGHTPAIGWRPTPRASPATHHLPPAPPDLCRP